MSRVVTSYCNCYSAINLVNFSQSKDGKAGILRNATFKERFYKCIPLGLLQAVFLLFIFAWALTPMYGGIPHVITLHGTLIQQQENQNSDSSRLQKVLLNFLFHEAIWDYYACVLYIFYFCSIQVSFVRPLVPYFELLVFAR